MDGDVTERKRKQLPAKVREHLDALEDLAWRLANGTPLAEGLVGQADYAYERAIFAAIEAGSGKRRAEVHSARILEWSQVVAENIRRLRQQAGWTQAKLANAMSKSGFNWTRVTVAEVEGNARAVHPTELLVLAGLFAEPMANLLIPSGPDQIVLPAIPEDDEQPGYISRVRTIDADVLVATLLGHAARVGELSPEDAEPMLVAGVAPGSRTDRRPAKDLHARRQQGYVQ
jgi:transcriptional regulator with XRE-family HTH domain